MRPLWHYVIAVLVVLAVLNGLMQYLGGAARARDVAIFSAGFLIGMLAMYIAVHVYSYR
jgi:hypothetical protein